MTTINSFARFILPLIFLAGCVSVSVAQNIFREGYVVRKNGDTLAGFVKILGNKNSPVACAVKSEGRTETYHPNDLLSVTLPGYRYYKTIPVDSVMVLAQELVRGKVSLYLVDDRFFLGSGGGLEELVVERVKLPDDKLFLKKKYVGILRSKLSDCPGLAAEIDRTRLTETSLSTLLEKYYECSGEKYLALKQGIPNFQFDFRPVVGATYFVLPIDVSNQFDYLYGFLETPDFRSVVPTFGGGLTITNPRISDDIAFNAEARYIGVSFYEEVYFDKSSWDQNRISIKYSAIMIPITLSYRLTITPESSITISGGLLRFQKLKGEISIYRRQSAYPDIPEQRIEDRFLFLKHGLGFTGGTGYIRKLGRLSVAAELRFEDPGPIINSTTIGFKPNIYSAVLMLSF